VIQTATGLNFDYVFNVLLFNRYSTIDDWFT